MIQGLSHITWVVRDLERTSGLLREIFGAQEIYSSGENRFSISSEKFFRIGEIWVCIMRGDPSVQRSYNHVAFQIFEADFDDYLHRIQHFGLEIRPGRARVPGEGRSIYFYDFDNHLFELHTGNLRDRLAAYSARG